MAEFQTRPRDEDPAAAVVSVRTISNAARSCAGHSESVTGTATGSWRRIRALDNES